MIPSPAVVFAVAWSSVLLGASATAIARSLPKSRVLASPPPHDDAARSVLLVRPVSGADAWLEGALASIPSELDRSTLRIRIAVADVEDEAYAVGVRAVSRLLEAGFSASLCVTAALGQNRKAAQLAAVLRHERAASHAANEVVIVADADVDLSASPLLALIEPFADPRVGATWAPPVERSPTHTLADRASQALLGGSLHAFPLLARLDEGGLVGKLCALRRSSLDAIGGFEGLVPWLGEDMRLAALLRARGIGFVATARPAISVANGRSTTAVLARYTRWLQVIRAQRPWLLLSYPALFFGTFPAMALCLGLAATQPAPWLALVAAGLLLARLLVARVAARAAGRATTWFAPFADAFLADGLLAAAFCLATTQRDVVWKTNRFTFDRRGQLREAEEARRAPA